MFSVLIKYSNLYKCAESVPVYPDLTITRFWRLGSHNWRPRSKRKMKKMSRRRTTRRRKWRSSKYSEFNTIIGRAVKRILVTAEMSLLFKVFTWKHCIGIGHKNKRNLGMTKVLYNTVSVSV